MVRSLEACPEVLTYDEMLYAPVYFGCRARECDNVLLDEAQDSNIPRIELVERMLTSRGRLLAVGDRHQSIYGFTGADADAMPNIIDRFDCKVLPLSVSFRCPQAVVHYAQQFVGLHIEAAPGAPDGRVRRTEGRDWTQHEQFRPDDVILCRYNAQLVARAYAFMREGIACRMAGRDDLGSRLRKLALRWGGVRTLDGLAAGLLEWLTEEERAALEKNKPERGEVARDLVSTLQVIIRRCREAGADNAAAVAEEISRLFGKSGRPALTLSSIHKAKGLEWPRVFWLLHQTPRWVQQEWQRGQENNLRYVAVTRAREELVLVDTVFPQEAA
jgi:DNA helicase II / ATP-dependent DNA helicase PcrA